MNITVIPSSEGGAIAYPGLEVAKSVAAETNNDAIVKLIQAHPEIFDIAIVIKLKE